MFKSMGQNVYVSKKASIRRPELIELGSHIAIDENVVISTKLKTGSYLHISPNVVFVGGKSSSVEIGNFCFIAAGTVVVAGSEQYTSDGLIGATIPVRYRELQLTTVKFEDFSGCGASCTILPGVTFGEGAILGANSTATKDLEPWWIYVGSPARKFKKRNKVEVINKAKSLENEF